MKNLIPIFLLAALSSFLFSCQEEEEPLVIHPPQDQGAWEIFQLVKIHVPNLNSSDESFSGSIDGVPISLGRIPGDSLVFIIPNVGEGPAQVKVSIGKQTRKWNLDLKYWPYYEDQKIFLGRVLKACRELKSKILEVDKLKELDDPFGQWIEFFNQKQLALSEFEKEYLSGSLQNRLNSRYLPRPDEKFELECINGPAFKMDSYRFLNFDNSYLINYKGLPSNGFHDAVLAGLGLSFWYQKVLLEYYAHLTLECPQLRGLELKEVESGNVILQGETFKIESNESISIGYNGIFKPLTASDLSVDDQFIVHAIGFRDKENASKVFSNMLQSYLNAYKWDLPPLDSKALIIPPNDSSISKGPISGLQWSIPYLDNPNIRFVDYKLTAESIMMKLESLDGNPQAFNLTVGVSTPSLSFKVIVPSLLEVTCPISMDVLLIGKTHFLDLKNGKLPYDITWSNGAKSELSQTLSPGNYDIKVTDADDCERTVLFTVPEFGTVEDIDGNVYETIKFGNTWWMTENLRTNRKNDGSSIILIEDDQEWLKSNQAAYTWFENDPARDETYGKLYNHLAICCDICPSGWSLPQPGDFVSLANSFGVLHARSLRAVNKWESDLTGSTNISGLNMLPSGTRSGYSGSFGNAPYPQEIAAFWTNQKDDKGNDFIFFISGMSDYSNISYSFSRNDGLSVRCIRSD